MSGPQCWHPTDAEVTADTEWCTDCGEPLDAFPDDSHDDADRLYESREFGLR